MGSVQLSGPGKDKTAWGNWMTGKIHNKVWLNFQQQSMDRMNQGLVKSKLVADREQEQAEVVAGLWDIAAKDESAAAVIQGYVSTACTTF